METGAQAATTNPAEAQIMGGKKRIGQKRQTRPDLGPARLAKETLLNRCDPHGGQGNGLRYLTLS